MSTPRVILFLPIACTILCAVFFSCHQPNPAGMSVNHTDSADSNISTLSHAKGYYPDYLRPVGDSLIIPSFEIELSLSPKAEQKIKSLHETIIVWAQFSGIPKDTTSQDYLESGQFFLAESRIELSDKRMARFDGVKFPKALYDSLDKKEINLLINVYTGRRVDPNNLLDCEILEKPMNEVQGKRFILKGKLIGE